MHDKPETWNPPRVEKLKPEIRNPAQTFPDSPRAMDEEAPNIPETILEEEAGSLPALTHIVL